MGYNTYTFRYNCFDFINFSHFPFFRYLVRELQLFPSKLTVVNFAFLLSISYNTFRQLQLGFNILLKMKRDTNLWIPT